MGKGEKWLGFLLGFVPRQLRCGGGRFQRAARGLTIVVKQSQLEWFQPPAPADIGKLRGDGDDEGFDRLFRDVVGIVIDDSFAFVALDGPPVHIAGPRG